MLCRTSRVSAALCRKESDSPLPWPACPPTVLPACCVLRASSRHSLPRPPDMDAGWSRCPPGILVRSSQLGGVTAYVPIPDDAHTHPPPAPADRLPACLPTCLGAAAAGARPGPARGSGAPRAGQRLHRGHGAVRTRADGGGCGQGQEVGMAGGGTWEYKQAKVTTAGAPAPGGEDKPQTRAWSDGSLASVACPGTGGPAAKASSTGRPSPAAAAPHLRRHDMEGAEADVAEAMRLLRSYCRALPQQHAATALALGRALRNSAMCGTAVSAAAPSLLFHVIICTSLAIFCAGGNCRANQAGQRVVGVVLRKPAWHGPTSAVPCQPW